MPANTPRAFRWSTIAEHWAKHDHQVDVVCALEPGLAHKETLKGIQIYRAGEPFSGVLRNKLSKSNVRSNISFNKPAKAETSLMQKLCLAAKWTHDITWKKVYWPDYACLWYFEATQKAKWLSTVNHYHSLVSVSPPFTGHLVALGVKKKHPKMKWLVDIGDPFCFLRHPSPNNHRLYKKLNYFVERKVLETADAITVTTEPASNKYLELFPKITTKIQVIPPLMSLPVNQTVESSMCPDNSKARLVFTGTLYKDIREPGFLLSLFEKLLQTHLGNKLELHFFGYIHDCRDCFKKYESLLGNKIFIHGVVSHSKVLQAMKDADILINIGNNTPYQLPSKVVEYAILGKPILNIVKAYNDISVEFFHTYPLTLNLLDTQNDSFLDQVKKVIQFIEHPPQVKPELLQQQLKSFHVEAIAAAYESLIQNIQE